MTQALRIVFIDMQLQQTLYDLPSDGDRLSPENIPTVMVLPALAALPFQVELPFSDPDKIARVLPQFVADSYVDVDEKWFFSWQLSDKQPDTTVWKIAGLAFPPEFAPGAIMPAADIRLAIPDTALLDAAPGQAHLIKTPVSSLVAIYETGHVVRRIFRTDAGLPVETLLAAERVESIDEVDLTADPLLLAARIASILENPCRLDISGYRQIRKSRLTTLLVKSGVALIAACIFLWHIFLWLECRVTESAAQRTRQYMQTAFSAAFPGIPAVEPITQTDRKITEIETRLKEAATLPKIPWQSFFMSLAIASDSAATGSHLTARESGFRLSGVAKNYTALEALRGRIETCEAVEKVATSESRQSDSGISFTLEGQWKR